MAWLLVFLSGIIPLYSLFHGGLPITHDGQDHVARIANFYQSLAEGNLIPRWASNLNWGYGHPILMFLYPFSSYVGSFFHVLGFSFVDSTKLVFGFGFIASMLAMYLFVKTVYGKRAGIVASILYGFAPYRFVDLYVRGAIGEHMAFVFLPLSLYFVFMLAQQSDAAKRMVRNIGLSLSIAALILSHNAIAIMFLPIIGLYALYLFFFGTKRNMLFLLHCFLSFVSGFGLSAFFWIPAYIEGKYTLRDIVTQGEFAIRFVPWSWFVYSPWNYGQGNELTKMLGISQWIGIMTTLYVLLKQKNRKLRIMLISLLVVLIGSFFIMTSWSLPIWQHITLLQKFQFPWRFLSVSVFCAAVLGGIAVAKVTEPWKKGTLILVVYCIFSIFITLNMWKPKGYLVKPETYFSGVYESTTDTGESSPIWSVRFMEHRPDKPMDIALGQITITPTKRTTTVRDYIVSSSDSGRLVENTLYFPGWKVYVDGIQTGIQYQDPTYRGLITFRVTEGTHTVHIVFEDTKLRKIATLVSELSIGVMGLIGLGIFLWKKRT